MKKLLLVSISVFTSIVLYSQGTTCLTATPVTVNGGCLTGITINDGTGNNPAPTCGTLGQEGWYSFTLTATTSITISATNGNRDLAIQLVNGPCVTPTQSQCVNAVAGTGTETLTAASLAAGTYFIKLLNVGSGSSMNVTSFCVNGPPSNDDCTGAIALTVNPTSTCTATTAGTVELATASSQSTASCGGTEDDDVWFSFVATSTSHEISLLNVTGSTTDMYHSVWSGTCPTLTVVSGTCMDSDAQTVTGLTIGNTYYVRVYTWTSTGGQNSDFNICIGTPPGPPANDECTGAYNVTVNANLNCGSVTAGTVESATASSQGTGGCFGTDDDDVWFQFTATGTVHEIDILNVTGSVTDMYHSVWTGPCASLSLVPGTCSDGNSQTVGGLTAGTTYYIRVYTYTSTGGQNTDFNVCVGTPPPPPANDECTGAFNVTVNPTLTCSSVTAGTVEWATGSSQATGGCFGTDDDDVWFQFTATNTSHQVSLLNVTGSTTDMYHSVWTGTCPTLSLVAGTCSDGDSQMLFGLTIGQVYYIRVFTYTSTSGQTSDFNVCVGTPPPPPANDDCSGAFNVTVNPTLTCTSVTAGTVESATPSSQATGGCFGTDDDDVWFQFTATSTVHQVSLLNVTGSVTDMYHSVWSGTCPTIGLMAGTCSDGNSQIVSGLTVGSVYFIRVYTYTSTTGQNTDFNVCVGTPPPPPANDECTGAVALSVSSSTTCNTAVAGTIESSTGSPQASGGCWGTDDDDVWYSFVATASSQTITLSNITGSTTDMYQSLWTGTCPNLTFVTGSCSDPETQTVTGLTVGQTYYVRVYTYTSTTGQTSDFNICITNPCPTCNNNPSGGNSTATLGTVCGNSTTLSVTGSVTGCAYAYQWQYSLDNTNWSDIPGATSETYVATPNADIYYRRIVRCPNNGNSNTSSVTFIDVTPGPSNDEPCTASALTVGTSCTFNTYTNTCATNSVTTVGAPTPSCTTFGGGDVWFTVTVPSGGSLTFDSDEGVITDMGMAIYSGTCTSLTQIACDDDGSTNGAMSYIAATGLTPGSTIWVRCWEYGGDANGTFDLCVYDPCPPCSGAPTAGTASANPIITNCGSPNTTLSLAGGSSGCGFSYQWQSSPDNAVWTSISGATSATYTTPVTTDTYFRCIIACIASSQSSTSNSVLVTTEIANSCSFTISTPAYSPDAAYTAGTLLTFPDDQMSNVIPIGFTFCFMGTDYTSCLVSSNSFISFNTATAGGYSAWVTVPIPTAVPDEALNSIMFPWHDIDPSVGVASDIRYLTSGASPNRKFIVNFSLTPMYSFSCNSMTYTGQVVLNETTNIIETYIQSKVVCSSWNSGNAVHGINGPDGCSGVVVPGRNNTQWTATNDAKMFTPTGCCSQPLSAEIIQFDGKQIEKNLNELDWVSSTETNLDKYIIEKSEDGIDFEYLTEIKAVGNSSYSSNYSANDNSPFERITYYRLRQVDLNGAYKYSNTISILNSSWEGFDVYNLFPNPSEGLVNAEIYATQEIEFTLEIKDISGRTIRTTDYSLQFGTNMMNFDLTSFESGIYFFNFISKSNGKVTSLRYIKE